MAKTIKYEMRVDTFNMTGNTIPLSKKKFIETLKNYQEQVDENIATGNAYREQHPESLNNEYDLDEVEIDEEEYETYTKTQYTIRDNGTVISLIKRETKAGYCWT